MIGRVIEGFQITEKLGEGGMGEVYKAVDTSLGRIVAVKALHSELTKDPQLTERFLAEARTQAQLNHPNLATLYRLFQFEDAYFMVMEYIDGDTVSQIVRREGPIPQDRALHLFKQALAGLSHAHHAGIIHRDIKPSNLMVNKGGIVKVMDFGIAKILGGRGLTATGVRLGTLYYMSPEQIRNQQLDIRTDIYALGITLYEMLTGRVPFDSNSDYELMQQHIQQVPPLPRQFFPYIAPGIEAAILQALEKDPARRFQTVEAFSFALDQGLSAAMGTTRPTVAAAPPDAFGQTVVASSAYPPVRPQTPAPTSGGFPSTQPTQVHTPVPTAATMPPRTPLPTVSGGYPASQPTVVATPVPGGPGMPPFTPAATPSGGYVPPSTPWPPQAPLPGPPYGAPPQEGAPRKSNAILVLVLGLVGLVVIIAGAFFGIRHFINARRAQAQLADASAQAAAAQQTQSPATTTPPTGSPENITTPAATPPPAAESEKPVEPKFEAQSRKKESRRTASSNQRQQSNQDALNKAAQQAMIQQQIEAERQRLQQQQQTQEQKNAPHPAQTTPPGPAKPVVYSFRVAHDHGDNFQKRCVGTLSFSKDRMSFKPDSGPDAFDVPTSEVREVKKNRAFWSVSSFHIRLGNGANYNFARLGPDQQIVAPTEILVQTNLVLPASVKR